jgi:predicted molibdopterin-dependent oxidoreductase YjgC
MPKSMKGRLTEPLLRENGSHRPATWDEALECVVAAFQKSIARDPQDFGMFSCSKTTNRAYTVGACSVRTSHGMMT